MTPLRLHCESGLPRLAVLAALLFVGCGGGSSKPSEPTPEPEKSAEAPAPAPAPAAAPAATPLRVAYSDWPGWTAFEVGIQKGWFKEAGVDVEFSWFDYLPSMEAFSAGKVDAVMVTNGDALVTGATGAKSKMILVTDYSNGNDKVIAQAGHQEHQAAQGQEDRPRADLGRAPVIAARSAEGRAEAGRRGAGELHHQRDRRKRLRPSRSTRSPRGTRPRARR